MGKKCYNPERAWRGKSHKARRRVTELQAAPARCCSVDPRCSICHRVISVADVASFQTEAGDTSLPDCCEDCAELAVLE